MVSSGARAERAPEHIPRLLKATYLTEGEKLFYESRPSRWIFLTGPAVFLILVAAINLILWKNVSGSPLAGIGWLPSIPSTFLLRVPYASNSWPVYLGIVLVLIGLLYLLARNFSWIRTVYVLTSTRVIRQTGIFSKDFDEIQLGQVRGVQVTATAFQRILGYGTLKLSAEALGPSAMANETWAGLPKPVKFQRLLESAQQALRNPYAMYGQPPAPAPPPAGYPPR